MALVDSLLVFLVSLLVGALGIHIGALLIADTRNYSYAVTTALIGALVWAIVGRFLGWIPLLGPALVLLAYLAVIKWRYRGGWITAAGIALVAWVTAVVVLSVLASAGVTESGAVGIPGI